MKTPASLWLSLLLLLACCPFVYAQQKAEEQPPTLSSADVQDKNVREYIELLRADVRQQKAQILGAVMQLDVDQAAKFWPIYNNYDAELTNLNNLRVANIQEYANNYTKMTDAKADELILKALQYRRERSELLAKSYERVKQVVGAIEAARFVQVEDQLLMIIDLQIASSLPIVGQGW